MSLELLLTVAFGGSLLTYILGKISPRLRDAFAVLVSIALVAMVASLYGRTLSSVFYTGFFGMPLVLRIDALPWFFAMATTVLGCLSTIFSLSYMRDRERTDFYYFMLLLINAAMLGVILAGDLLSFFIFWEIMSWSTFLTISSNRGAAVAAGLKYIVMSVLGSMAMLAGMLTLHTIYGTLEITELAALVATAPAGYQIFLLVIFGFAFGIKNAIMPLHTWLPDAYAEAPSPFTAVLSGMLTRMGIYGFLLIMYVIVGSARYVHAGTGVATYNHVLAWLGAITIVIPTFIAMLQNDAKKLLAWHGVGQGGYMIVGIAFGTSLGVAGGVFHTLNHAIYIVLLFMSVAAVQYRTGGVRDLNSLGGLIHRMPIAFVGGLLGICGLIGVPLTNGFVSKWLIYKTLIVEGSPFLAFAALVGTWGTILSVYKFLHNMFLGQLPSQYKDVKQSPLSMKIPILILSFTILLFGVLPGIPLTVINRIISSFGFQPLELSLWGIASEAGTLSTINIFAAILVVGAIVWLVFRAGPRPVRVSQDDNYAAGAAVPVDRYQFSVSYYAPLFRMITPYLKDFCDIFYQKLAGWIENTADGLRKIYTGHIGTNEFSQRL